MLIFNKNDYRTIIKETVGFRKRYDIKCNFKTLAEASKLQPPHLSKIINLNAHMSRDQLYLACKFLEYDEKQTEFLEVMHDYQTSYLKERKQFLKRKLKALRSDNLATDSHLKLESQTLPQIDRQLYYLDPWHQLIHVILSIPYFQRDPYALCSLLGLSKERIRVILNGLEDMKIIKKEGDKYKSIVESLYLSRNANEFQAWSQSIRLKSLNRISTLSPNDFYSFSLTFSANEDTRTKIQGQFLEFLENCREDVESAPEKKAYQLNFDLHPWT